MASAAEILDELDKDDTGNEELLNFYEQNSTSLNSIPLSEVDPSQLRKIAEMLHSNRDYGEHWREYGYSFGIKNYYDLDSIKQEASVCNELPLYIALISALRQGKCVGQIIIILKSKERFDVLRRLKSYIESLLSERCENNSCDEETSKEKGASTQDQMPTGSVEAVQIAKDFKYCFKSTDKCENSRKNESMQNRSLMRSTIKDTDLSNSTDICLNIQPKPSAPPCKQLSVFIMHTYEDTSEANKLADILKEKDINVLKYSDIDPFIMVDSLGALTSVFSRVDFIVPIVSSSFLQHIYPQDFEKYTDSEDAMNNRCLYQLLTNEFRKNRCLNFRVRSMLVPAFKKSLLKNNLILSSSLRLWSEVPKLINMLQKTKEILPSFSTC